MQKITPFLWFDTQAEEAATFYTSIFRNSKVGTIVRYGEGAPMPAGTALTVAFELEGQRFVALNGGPMCKFTHAVSFAVSCETQEELDEMWSKLSDGGTLEQCGWLRDKYGLSWQIVPASLGTLLDGSDPARASRVMQALLQMVKLDIATLQRAYDGA